MFKIDMHLQYTNHAPTYTEFEFDMTNAVGSPRFTPINRLQCIHISSVKPHFGLSLSERAVPFKYCRVCLGKLHRSFLYT